MGYYYLLTLIGLRAFLSFNSREFKINQNSPSEEGKTRLLTYFSPTSRSFSNSTFFFYLTFAFSKLGLPFSILGLAFLRLGFFYPTFVFILHNVPRLGRGITIEISARFILHPLFLKLFLELDQTELICFLAVLL